MREECIFFCVRQEKVVTLHANVVLKLSGIETKSSSYMFLRSSAVSGDRFACGGTDVAL